MPAHWVVRHPVFCTLHGHAVASAYVRVMLKRLAARAGIERDKIRDVMAAMRRIMDELRAEGDAFELDPETQTHLEGLGLTEDQIELVVGLSQRLASRPADADRGRCDARSDWDRIKRRIEGAVERGDITREEADAKYIGIKERMAGEEDRVPE